MRWFYNRSRPMHVVELSNHPEAMRRDLQQRREEGERAEQAQYEEALAAHNAGIEAMREQQKSARAKRQLWKWLSRHFEVRRAREGSPARPRAAIRASDDEEILSAGAKGEQLAVSRLGDALNREWYLFRGYRNRRGEIDQLLVGPTGLYAIEVKYLNAVVSCEGDDWWYKHFDKYGNFKREGSIADRGGRSPSEQLNMPCNALEEFLRSRGQAVQIWRIVLFTHPSSQVVYCGDQTVDLITDSTADVIAYIRSAPAPSSIIWARRRSETHLPASQLSEIERLIKRDHEHHNARRTRHRSRQ